MSAIIRVENLGKKYLIGHQRREPYLALREVMANSVRKYGRKLLHPFASSAGLGDIQEEFWALKEVSFTVNQGDCLGIIGRNGAGKSTLLKILSRITEPSAGKFCLKGRVASLLEVGTGFHPELTGRENIFLNGAILGMSKAEIKRKFDEIVAFAEVERFLDTPVKRYSSGMYVRLAFAVAAHLEPEILIVDEVLAVGDAQFQKKCLGKMEKVGKEGRTVLFVSHNMGAIKQLCCSGLLLRQGQESLYYDDVSSIIKTYLAEGAVATYSEWVNDNLDQNQNDWFIPLKIFIADKNGNRLSMPLNNLTEIWVQIDLEIKRTDPALNFGYAIYTEDGILLYWSVSTDSSEDKWPKINEGICSLRSLIPIRFLNEGTYKIVLLASLHYRQWLYNPNMNSPFITITTQGRFSDSPYWTEKRPGILAPVMSWEIIN